MDASLNTQELGRGITFCSVQDKRFKTNRISVNLVTELSADTVTVNALIPPILKDGFEGCEDFSTLNRRMEELYGAWYDADVKKRGDRQILSLFVTTVDDRFSLKGEPLREQAAELLTNMLLHPITENGGFRPKYTDLEKDFLRDAIEAEINEKRTYAVGRMLKTMCAGEPYALPKYGFKERIAEISPQKAYEQYQSLLKNARIYVFFTGCGDPEPVEKVFSAAFSSLERTYEQTASVAPHPQTGAPVREETEQMDVSQSKMVFGFASGIGPTDPRFPAMRLMSFILGGTPSSKFFVNVREKLSLCYYCSAMLDASKGVLIADCGVEAENIQKAREAILEQLKAISRGDVTKEELESARLSAKNAFATIYENDSTIESFYLGQLLNGLSSTPVQERTKLDAIQLEDIVDAAKLFSLDTVYLLTGKEAE